MSQGLNGIRLLWRTSPVFLVAGLLLTTNALHSAAEDLLLLPEGRVMAKTIDDNGNAWIAVQSRPDGGETYLTLWRGAESQTLTLDTTNVKYAHSLSDGRLVIWDCLPMFEGDNHCNFSYRLYRLTADGTLQFDGEWDPFSTRSRTSSSRPTEPCGAPRPTSSTTPPDWRHDLRVRRLHRTAAGRRFVLGTTASEKIEREERVAFYTARAERSSTDSDDNDFIFLDVEGPVVLVPYGEHLHLLRFGNGSVDRLRPDQLRSARKSSGFNGLWSGYNAIWQPEDRLLWAQDRDSGSWLAYDLSRLGTEWEFPTEPSLRLNGSGHPHPEREYTRTISKDGQYRAEHVWQSPRSEHPQVRHISGWLEGPAPVPRGPVPLYSDAPAVSRNGRHGLAIEQRSLGSNLGRLWTFARRFELAPAPPEGEAAATEQ